MRFLFVFVFLASSLCEQPISNVGRACLARPPPGDPISVLPQLLLFSVHCLGLGPGPGRDPPPEDGLCVSGKPQARGRICQYVLGSAV